MCRAASLMDNAAVGKETGEREGQGRGSCPVCEVESMMGAALVTQTHVHVHDGSRVSSRKGRSGGRTALQGTSGNARTRTCTPHGGSDLSRPTWSCPSPCTSAEHFVSRAASSVEQRRQ